MPHFFLSLFFSPQALREAEASRQLEEARILKEAREKRQREERERRKIDLLALCLLNAQLLYFYYCFYCFVFFIYILPSVVDRQKAEDLQREREQYEREQGLSFARPFRQLCLNFFDFLLDTRRACLAAAPLLMAVSEGAVFSTIRLPSAISLFGHLSAHPLGDTVLVRTPEF